MAKRAPGTRAHTCAVQPAGTTRERDVLNGADRLDTGTLTVTDVNPGGTVVGVAAAGGAVASVEVDPVFVGEEHAVANTPTTRAEAPPRRTA
jgi:hypothetical protein